MNPRILFVDHAGVLGGAELYLLDILKRIRMDHHTVLFEEGPFLDRLRKEGVPVSVMKGPDAVMGVARSGGKFQDLKAVPGIMSMVMKLAKMARSYDVLYANSQKAFIIGALAGQLANRPVIWNLHDVLTADHFSASHRKIAVALANRFTKHVIMNSEATRRAYIACGGKASNTSVVYNGIDPDPFEEVSDLEVKDLRESLGITNQIAIGLFSRLTPWKGQHILMRAIAQLPGVHAMLVGGALFQDDATYEKELRTLAKDLNVEDRVHFLGFRDDVPRLMKAVDIVVHCSTAPEPFGRVIVEGMMAEKPVIGAKAGGAIEIISEGDNGLLVEPGNPEALRAAINRLCSDEVFALRLAQTGYESAYRRFAIDSIVLEIENNIRKVLDIPDVIEHPEASVTPV